MPDSLSVIALVSGGKDSFFSILHCLRQNHRVVALANLHAGSATAAAADDAAGGGEGGLEIVDPQTGPRSVRPAREDSDLNSFMYQTVGHGVIPLYAAATGLPLYRRAITGAAAQSGRDYDGAAAAGIVHGDGGGGGGGKGDETESMTELLRGVMRKHPEANAVCAGAILSTYQRTRVESVAARLGLVSLAYLWKYPALPAPSGDDAQLLRDMAAAGLDARVIKVASAGLDEDMLWERVSSERGVARAKKGLRLFGGAEGAVLGEGGEYETIVVDGPGALFRGRVAVEEGERVVVREGGGCSWLSLTGASVESKGDGPGDAVGAAGVRVPDLLDAKFASILEALEDGPPAPGRETVVDDDPPLTPKTPRPSSLRESGEPSTGGEDAYWGGLADPQSLGSSIEDKTRSVMEKMASHIQPHFPSCITNTIVLLRRMADFPAVNKAYGSLFPFPNPPSRVAISCGDLLPQGHNIAVYVAFRPGLAAADRNGLHVQSLSYWAPANIGPYSQAIDVPVLPSRTSSASSPSQGPRWVAIAGQIPLVPSTMELPTPSESSLDHSVVLSLQHLWRIAAEMQVQLWTSAVAYFPRAPDTQEMARRAALAGTVWRRAHVDTSDEDEDESGPDLWDRRFNPEYLTLGDGPAGPVPLPDPEVFKGAAGGESRGEPPFFAVEVEELPRGAAVEWHAHAGLSRVGPGTVQTGRYSGISAFDDRRVRWRSCLMTVACGRQTLLHNVVSIEDDEEGGEPVGAGGIVSLDSLLEAVWKDSVVAAGVEGDVSEAAKPPSPYLVYRAMGENHDGGRAHETVSSGVPFIPCRSIWTAGGKRAIAVALFRTMF